MKINDNTADEILDVIVSTDIGKKKIIRDAIKIIAQHGLQAMDWVREMNDAGQLLPSEIDEAQLQFEDFQYSDELKDK